jgi:hypothetical protein
LPSFEERRGVTDAREAAAVMASAKVLTRAIGISWPMPGMIRSSAPGIFAAGSEE